MRNSSPSARRPNAQQTLGLTLGAIAALIALGVLAGTGPGRSVDESVLNFFNQQAGNAFLLDFGNDVQSWAITLVVIWTVEVVVLAVRRRSFASAAVVAVLPVAASATAELVKNHVAVAHDKLGASLPVSLDHTWPSAHAALAASVAITAVWVSRSRVGLAAGFALAAVLSVSQLLVAAHVPSDVVGGWLVCVAWAAALSALPGLVRRSR